MRVRIASLVAALGLVVWGLIPAPADASSPGAVHAALKQQEPSSDLPWVIGIVVLLGLAAAGGWLMFRRPRGHRADRRNQPGGWS